MKVLMVGCGLCRTHTASVKDGVDCWRGLVAWGDYGVHYQAVGKDFLFTFCLVDTVFPGLVYEF